MIAHYVVDDVIEEPFGPSLRGPPFENAATFSVDDIALLGPLTSSYFRTFLRISALRDSMDVQARSIDLEMILNSSGSSSIYRRIEGRCAILLRKGA